MGGKPRQPRKPKPRAPLGDMAVRKGQTYRVPRTGKPARHVRIAGVSRADPRQPKASYYLVTRSGRRVEPRGALLYVTWLQWREGQWRPPSGWEPVQF